MFLPFASSLLVDRIRWVGILRGDNWAILLRELDHPKMANLTSVGIAVIDMTVANRSASPLGTGFCVGGPFGLVISCSWWRGFLSPGFLYRVGGGSFLVEDCDGSECECGAKASCAKRFPKLAIGCV